MSVKSSRFEGIYLLVDGDQERLATMNFTPGIQIIGEKLLKWKGCEYRLWSPYRSKLSTAILKGLTRLGIQESSAVLYLGAASGTTASYISDIVGSQGIVFCVDFAPRPMKELLRVCELRTNMIPLLADARHPESYSHMVTEVDFIYQDVAQPNQSQIYCSNTRAYLRADGCGILMVKSQSIDVARKPQDVFDQEMDELRKCHIKIDETIPLDPFVKDHIAIATSI